MNREQIIELLSNKLKLVRVEKGYTQDRMAFVLGISKKTLVQIEKGRSDAGWTTAVAMCALFRDSEVIQSVLGNDPIEVLETMAHEEVERPKQKTMGGHVWWSDVEIKNSFRLQQNLVSKHYRILDDEAYRWYSSFNEKEARQRFNEISTKDSR
ncbi:helix-turn-helix transcriptional regulator [Bacillus taeanensis]|uniref:Transcriptional regulator n=1 Tax=Bacillus taeanensis TaxID=273032 RepID=A0A366XXX8_9BACI|nr:helix-turn-helix domain-containing protein [Bacillus taeanensis]RBW69004.1 transcriptional regulator [Bacillus taeanensis]